MSSDVLMILAWRFLSRAQCVTGSRQTHFSTDDIAEHQQCRDGEHYRGQRRHLCISLQKPECRLRAECVCCLISTAGVSAHAAVNQNGTAPKCIRLNPVPDKQPGYCIDDRGIVSPTGLSCPVTTIYHLETELSDKIMSLHRRTFPEASQPVSDGASCP